MSGAVWKIFSPRLDSAVSAHFRSPLPLSPSPLIWCPWRTEDDNQRPPKRRRRRRRRGASFLLRKGLRPTHKLVVHKLPQMRATSCCCCVGGGGGGGPLHSTVIFAIVIPEASPPSLPPSPPLSFLRRSAGDRPAEGPLGQTTRIHGGVPGAMRMCGKKNYFLLFCLLSRFAFFSHEKKVEEIFPSSPVCSPRIEFRVRFSPPDKCAGGRGDVARPRPLYIRRVRRWLLQYGCSATRKPEMAAVKALKCRWGFWLVGVAGIRNRKGNQPFEKSPRLKSRCRQALYSR